MADKNKIEVFIDGTAKGLQDAASKAESITRGLGSKIQSGMGTIVKAAGVAAVAGFAALGAAAWKTGQDLIRIEQIGAQTSAVIESTGGAANVTREHLETMADSMEKLTSVEAESIQEGQNLLLTFTNVQNRVGAGNDIFDQATQAILDMSVAMGQDMQQTAIQVGKALNDPIQGVTALRRVGVQLTDEQQEQVKSFMEVNDVASAQKVILQELQKEFSGSAEALGKTLGGQLEIVKHRMGEVAEAAMETMMPAVQDIATGLNEMFESLAESGELTEAFSAFGDVLNEIFPIFRDLVNIALQFTPIFAGFFSEAAGYAADLVRGLVDSGLVDTVGRLLSLFSEMLLDVIAAAMPAVNAGFDALNGALVIIEPIIRTVGDAVSVFAGLIEDLPGWLVLAGGALAIFGPQLLALATGPVSMLNSATIGLLQGFGMIAAHPVVTAAVVGAGIFYGLYKWAESVMNATDPMKERFDQIENEWDEMSDATRRNTVAILENQLANATDEVEQIRLRQEIEKLNDQMTVNAGAVDDATKKMDEFARTLDDNATAAMEMLPEMEKLGEGMAAQGREFAGTVRAMMAEAGPAAIEGGAAIVKGFMQSFGQTWNASYSDIGASAKELAGLLASPAYYSEAGQQAVRDFITNLVDTGQMEQDAAVEFTRMLSAEMGSMGIEGGQIYGDQFIQNGTWRVQQGADGILQVVDQWGNVVRTYGGDAGDQYGTMFTSEGMAAMALGGQQITDKAAETAGNVAAQGGPAGSKFGSDFNTELVGHMEGTRGYLLSWWDGIREYYSHPVYGRVIVSEEGHGGHTEYHEGGLVRAHQGLFARNEVPALLLEGEGVINRAAVAHYGGQAFIDAINSMALGTSQGIGVQDNSVRNITQNNYIETQADLDEAFREMGWRCST